MRQQSLKERIGKERYLNLGVKGVPALERHHGLEWKCVLDLEWREHSLLDRTDQRSTTH